MTTNELLHKITARFRKNPLYSNILQLTGREPKQHQWIFIVGCYNSGTTLLDQILAKHPKISGLPDEGVMLTNKLTRPEDFNWRRMWWKCEKEMEKPENQNKDAEIIKKHWSHFYDLKKPFLLEKSIANTCRIPFFEKNFQKVSFIHLVRNGYAVAEGIQRKAAVMDKNLLSGKDKYPIEMCAQQWVRSLQKVEEDKKKSNRFLEIKYEDLTSEPNKILNQITDFLNLENLDPSIYESSFSVHEKKRKITNMNDASFKRLKEEDVKKINEVAADFLRKYNYEVFQP